MEAMNRPPNPPLDSLDLYKRLVPPQPGFVSPNLAPSGKRAQLDRGGIPEVISVPDSPVILHRTPPSVYGYGRSGASRLL